MAPDRPRWTFDALKGSRQRVERRITPPRTHYSLLSTKARLRAATRPQRDERALRSERPGQLTAKTRDAVAEPNWSNRLRSRLPLGSPRDRLSRYSPVRMCVEPVDGQQLEPGVDQPVDEAEHVCLLSGSDHAHASSALADRGSAADQLLVDARLLFSSHSCIARLQSRVAGIMCRAVAQPKSRR